MMLLMQLVHLQQFLLFIIYFNYGKINYIDFPDNLESQYQAYTQADMTNLKKVGYLDNFTTLESGVEKYLDWLSNNS